MKQKIIKYAIIVSFCVIFPYILTTIFSCNISRSDGLKKIYEPPASGQTIILQDSSGTSSINTELFIPCVLMSMLDITDEEELLKAMAVIIRTEITTKMQTLSSIDVSELNETYTTYADMERKWGDKFSEYYNYLMKIINNTSCKVIKYNGNVINPLYHNISAGFTRPGNVPYLISAESVGDYEQENYLHMYYLTNQEFVDKVKKISSDISIDTASPLTSVQIVARDGAGYVTKLMLGTQEITGDEFAKTFALSSTNMTIETFNGQIRIITKGDGHGFGFSIAGARTYAAAGQSYIQLLKHYYSNDITIE